MAYEQLPRGFQDRDDLMESADFYSVVSSGFFSSNHGSSFSLTSGNGPTSRPPSYNPLSTETIIPIPLPATDKPEMFRIDVDEAHIIIPGNKVLGRLVINASERFHATRIRIKLCAEERATVRLSNLWGWGKDMVHETVTKFFETEYDLFGENIAHAHPRWTEVGSGALWELRFYITFPRINFPPAILSHTGYGIRYILKAYLAGPYCSLESEERTLQYRPWIAPLLPEDERWVYQTVFKKKDGRAKLSVHADVDKKTYTPDDLFKATLSFSLLPGKWKRRKITKVTGQLVRHVEWKSQLIEGTAFNSRASYLSRRYSCETFKKIAEGQYEPVTIVIPFRRTKSYLRIPTFSTDHIRIRYEVNFEILYKTLQVETIKYFSIPVIMVNGTIGERDRLPIIRDYRSSSECPYFLPGVPPELPLQDNELLQQEQTFAQETEHQQQLPPAREDELLNQQQQEQLPAEEDEPLNQQQQQLPPIEDIVPTLRQIKTVHLTRLTRSYDHLPEPRIVKERFDDHW